LSQIILISRISSGIFFTARHP